MVRVENLAAHPELVELIARWHWDEWGDSDPDGSIATWTSGLRERLGRDAVPMTFVALDERETPIGSVCLVEHDMPGLPRVLHLTPWIAAAYVVPERRRHGVGRALMTHSQATAAGMGIANLYLYTSTAGGFYEELGWRPIESLWYEGGQVTVMALHLVARHEITTPAPAG
jgi:GNAT superfamily N-acetyltransferase